MAHRSLRRATMRAASSALIAPDRPPPSRPDAHSSSAWGGKATMTPELRDEIAGLEGPLLTYATQVCDDAEEARDLVQLTLRTALDGAERPKAGDTRLWLFRLMRNAFHSVARRQAISR